MEQDTQKTIVVFRTWRKSGGALALFPEILANNRGQCESYEHIGQHSGADYLGCIERTRAATPAEYRDLKRELEGIGYRLAVRRRWTPRRRA